MSDSEETVVKEELVVKEEIVVKKKPKYSVVTVEKTAAPEGLPGDNWHRYVIGQGNSIIEGRKPGTLKAVTQHAKEAAEELNSRTNGSGSTYATRKKT